MPLPDVPKLGRYLHWCRYNTTTWKTDRRTDRNDISILHSRCSRTWRAIKQETQLTLTNHGTHLCSMQRRGWPIKHAPPHICYRIEFGKRFCCHAVAYGTESFNFNCSRLTPTKPSPPPTKKNRTEYERKQSKTKLEGHLSERLPSITAEQSLHVIPAGASALREGRLIVYKTFHFLIGGLW